jgi:hypothetical protein
MCSMSKSNVTSGFIDLATFDEIEKYLYGGEHANAYFVRETRKATWFTQVPVVLSRASGSANFGQEWSVSISRAGDYLLQTWLRVCIPEVSLKAVGQSGITVSTRIRWTRNLMHNLIRECCITFNDLVVARFDNYHLDFWAMFTVPNEKLNGYGNMIGETTQLISQHIKLPEKILNLPLPFFYGRDSGVALPTAALPYNEMKITFQFRDWKELIILEECSGTDDITFGETFFNKDMRIPITENHIISVPKLKECNVWANYAIVSNDERKRMACTPRDILIEQVQTIKRSPIKLSNLHESYDIRFSHAIKVLFFSVRNTTYQGEWSNYTTGSPIPLGNGISGLDDDVSLMWGHSNMVDPICEASLIYENTTRLQSMSADYYSLVNPYFHGPTIPDMPGYHCYSYSLNFISLDPMGSTNYGKLTNVSIIPEYSSLAKIAEKGIPNVEERDGIDFPQTYEFILTAINNNIIRVSGGVIGFPIL